MAGDRDEDWDEETRVSGQPAVMPSHPSSTRKAYLIVLAGSCVGQVHDLHSGAVIGRTLDADVVIPDDQISRRHAQLVVAGEKVTITDLESRNGTYVNGQPVRQMELKDGDRVHLGGTTVLKFSFGDGLEETFSRQMYDAAMRDAITGLYNRRHFEDRFKVEFAYALRHGTPLSLLVLDIDHFKKVNDTHGHVAGDRVLRELGSRLRSAVRSEDTVARYGGEEFCVLTRGTPLDQARGLAERLRLMVASTPIRVGSKELQVTVSIGVATLGRQRAATELFADADQALYAAKSGGRNRVMVDGR